MSTQTWQIETRSPLHIGSGAPPLRADIDVVRVGKRLYRLNTEAVLAVVLPRESDNPELFEQILTSYNLGSFVTEGLLAAHPDLYRYRIGMPIEQYHDDVLPIVSHPDGRSYIPGSSVKGAIRTAVLRLAVELDRVNLLDTKYERQVFSGQLNDRSRVLHFANGDIFRALQITDSTLINTDHINIETASVWFSSKSGIPISLEVLDPGVCCSVRIKIDKKLVDCEEIDWQGSEEYLNSLWDICQSQGRKRIEYEGTFWTARNAPCISKFYDRLAVEAKSDECFFIELGWGPGRMNKSVLSVVPDQGIRAHVISKYKLKGGMPPKTRRVILNPRNQPQFPLGWVKVTRVD